MFLTVSHVLICTASWQKCKIPSKKNIYHNSFTYENQTSILTMSEYIQVI